MDSITYIEINNPDTKAAICDHICHSLPGWFGIEEAIVDYSCGVRSKPFFAAYDINNTPLGFIALQECSAVASEVYVMGIQQAWHKQGIGNYFINWAKNYARKNGNKLLLVKTLSSSHPDKNYAQTRAFYEHVGFSPLEELPELWGKNCPCLNMVMFL